MDRVNCPAKHKKCNGCQRLGHFEEACEQSRTASASSNQQQHPPVDANVEQSLPSETIPFPPTKENRGKLEKYLLDFFASRPSTRVHI